MAAGGTDRWLGRCIGEDGCRFGPAGFLLVKRFEILYEGFARKPRLDRPLYAIPDRGTTASRLRVRYRGLDREPPHPYDWQGVSVGLPSESWVDHPNAGPPSMMAEIRLSELAAVAGCDTCGQCYSALTMQSDAQDVLAFAEYESPGTYEMVWAKVAGTSSARAPTSMVLLGCEPSYFPCGVFSPLCDSMCFPRAHGTDLDGRLFREYFDQLNASGLFDQPAAAQTFLDYYTSFDWTEGGEYRIAEVWGSRD